MARTYRQKSPPLRFFLTIFLPAVSFEDHRSSKETGNLEVAASEGKCHRRGGGRRRADLSKKISSDLFSSNRGMETMNTYKDVFFSMCILLREGRRFKWDSLFVARERQYSMYLHRDIFSNEESKFRYRELSSSRFFESWIRKLARLSINVSYLSIRIRNATRR